MNYRKALGSFAVAAACFGTLTACDDFLTVEQNINPAASSIFENDSEFESALGTTFSAWWGVAQSSRQYNGEAEYPQFAFSGAAGELTVGPTTSNGDINWVIQEPRVEYDNDQNGAEFLTRKPFYHMYQCISAATDAMQYLRANPTRRIYNGAGEDAEDHTDRVYWFAKFVRGICLGYEAIMLDQAYPIPEDYQTQERIQNFGSQIVPHWEMRDHAIEVLEDAIQAMKDLPLDTLPIQWINGRTNMDNVEVQKIAHSFIARILAYEARTPQQRQNVDWAKVLEHLDQGITEDLWVQGEPNNGDTTNTGSGRFDSQYKRRIADALGSRTDQSNNNLNEFRISNYLVGPSDTSGAFQTWYASEPGVKDHFWVKSPDRRVNGPGTATVASYRHAGKYFGLKLSHTGNTNSVPLTGRDGTTMSNCSSTQLSQQGLTSAQQGFCVNPHGMSRPGGSQYHRSIYYYRRIPFILFGTAQDHRNYYWHLGQLTTMSVQEMEFLRAEALIRTGQVAQGLTVLNGLGRVSNGELPPVTATGGTLPSCVPRKYTDKNQCGDLLDHLVYERRMELAGLEGTVMWADARGFGLMLDGTICQLPIPGRELRAIGVPYYSFGGLALGSVGRAPTPWGTTCSD